MTPRLLVWPLSSDGIPLQPKQPGWVLGWELDEGLTVVCAGILQERRVDTNSIVGKWDPTTASRRSSSVPCFIPTTNGPWWEDESPEMHQQQQQLLLYQPGVFYLHEAPWSGGFFPRILWHVNEASRLVERPNHGDTTPIQYWQQNGPEEDTRYGTVEKSKIKDASKDKENNLTKRLWLFVTTHSMLVLHWKHSHGFFSKLPAVQLFFLLQKSRPHQNEVKSYISFFNEALLLAINCMLGILAGLLLFHKTDAILTLLEEAWKAGYNELLRGNIQWLETFPAGFKLNEPLTQNMGREITMLIGVYDSIFGRALVLKTWIAKGCAIVSIIFGFTALVAFCHDLLILTTMHIATVATCFRVMHRTQLYLLASLWKLFRGRKKNVLRHRTDTMEYDSMQLLLGMILFTAVLFLFTTILVYYAFFAVLHLAIQIIGVVLWSLYVTVPVLPVGKCVLRAMHPDWFSERVFLDEVATLSKSRIVTRLVPVRRSFISILSDPLATYFLVFLSKIPSFFGEFLSGRPCTIREMYLSIVRVAPTSY
jgi:hypothetical protein